MFGHLAGKSLPQPYGKQIWEFDREEQDMIATPMAAGIKGLFGSGMDELPPKFALGLGIVALVSLTGYRVYQTRELVKLLQQQQMPGISYQGNQQPQAAPQPMTPQPQPQQGNAPEHDEFDDIARGDVDAA